MAGENESSEARRVERQNFSPGFYLSRSTLEPREKIVPDRAQLGRRCLGGKMTTFTKAESCDSMGIFKLLIHPGLPLLIEFGEGHTQTLFDQSGKRIRRSQCFQQLRHGLCAVFFFDEVND